MTSIFETTRAVRHAGYRAWLLDTNMALITRTGRGLDQEPVGATLLWRWWRLGVQPADAAARLAAPTSPA